MVMAQAGPARQRLGHAGHRRGRHRAYRPRPSVPHLPASPDPASLAPPEGRTHWSRWSRGQNAPWTAERIRDHGGRRRNRRTCPPCC
jgi:hypothetical protein